MEQITQPTASAEINDIQDSWNKERSIEQLRAFVTSRLDMSTEPDLL